MQRLNKFIASSGFCSRRKADEYIENGDVVGVCELQGVVIHHVDFLDLPGHYVLHGVVHVSRRYNGFLDGTCGVRRGFWHMVPTQLTANALGSSPCHKRATGEVRWAVGPV